MLRGLPSVDVPVPAPDKPSEDEVFDGFASFVTGNVRYVAVAVIVVVLMLMWKKPLWRGILIGALILTGVMFFAG